MVLLAALNPVHAGAVRLDQLDLTPMTSGWGKPQRNLSITQRPLGIGGVKFEYGVGTHAESEITVQLDGKAKLFTAKVGVDDNAGDAAASLEFIIFGDGRELWRSGVCKLGEKPRECRVNLDTIKSVELVVTAAGNGVNYDHADWADAAFEFDGAPPQTMRSAAPVEDAVLLTPPAPREPRINGPRVYGARPGSPFLYRIPCTGERPMFFHAEGLPEGLELDSQSGIISGKIAKPGTHPVALFARNALGEVKSEFRIEAGNRLALTPPMGWNSWYIFYNRVTEALMRQAAEQMINTGMADFGYQYVNIDDCWMKAHAEPPYRDADGAVLPNAKFPDMKGLADSIHSKGLKAGLYTSPGPWTCGDYVGAYQHEAADARKFADWGFDFLKYDWCSYQSVADTKSPGGYQRPYRQMWDLLQKLNRDIVFNLCQYGMDDVWKWGGQVGNCWRTTGDLGAEPGSRLPGFFSIALSNASHWPYAKPGAWNDPDYILIGWVGDAQGSVQTPLTPSEQYSYMSLWCLMAAPLIFSGDMAKLDAFTLNVLCNSEVIAVDQDALGRQARIVKQTRDQFILVKDLEDGSKAVGIFNLDWVPRKLSVSWADLGLAGPQKTRDLWRQKNIGVFSGSFETGVSRHGVALVRFSGK
jgi:alpha-galactosidase